MKIFQTCLPRFVAFAVLVAFGNLHMNAQQLVFMDDFDGADGAQLAGAAPSYGPLAEGNETWLASQTFSYTGSNAVLSENADVVIEGSQVRGSSAMLPINLDPGLIYTVTATVQLTAGGSSNWGAIGFASGDDVILSETRTNASLSNPNTAGHAWVLYRLNNQNVAFAGPATSGNQGGQTVFSGDTLEMRVVLDASDLDTTVLARLPGESEFTSMYSFTGGGTIEDYQYVAISAFESDAIFTDFSVTAIPEPRTVTLFAGMAAIGLIFLRRRFRRTAIGREDRSSVGSITGAGNRSG